MEKIIIVQDFVTFINLEDRPKGVFENTYKSGYWNVYNYNEEAIKFLDDNHIDYKVKEDNDNFHF